MAETPLTDASEITFEEAIALTQTILTQLGLGNMAEAEIAKIVTALVASENGARGFFVTYLTDDRPLADHPSDSIVQALKSSPVGVAELLVKNLAMSSAMAIAHRRNQAESMAQGSDRVKRRTLHLIERLQLPEVTEKAAQLRDSAATGTGEYEAFLQRWGYDAEQRQAIEQAVGAIVAQE
ncbi:MAG: hypothetical protein MUF49_21725 [Oculatellaceae cyanobacterium Prado106]|jgi:hypothetical protein|nr:hypothetical protein [Oculatellaceae cyanobacterium Prado106]